MPFAKLKHTELHYQLLPCEAGRDAEYVVMIHGLAASMAFWYFQVAPRIAQEYNVLVYDLKGHGKSQMPMEGYGAQEMAEDLGCLLDSLQIPRAHLITHSFGGLIGMHFALRFPFRAASLTLADSHLFSVRQQPCWWNNGDRIRSALRSCGINLDTADPFFGYRLLEEVAKLRVMGMGASSALADLAPVVQGRAGIRVAKKWLRLLETTDAEENIFCPDGLTDDRLEQVTCPVLALYGELSQALMSGQHLARLLPSVDFRVVPKAGHFFPVTNPRKLSDAWFSFRNKSQVGFTENSME